jgi:hypothetical protein
VRPKSDAHFRKGILFPDETEQSFIHRGNEYTQTQLCQMCFAYVNSTVVKGHRTSAREGSCLLLASASFPLVTRSRKHAPNGVGGTMLVGHPTAFDFSAFSNCSIIDSVNHLLHKRDRGAFNTTATHSQRGGALAQGSRGSVMSKWTSRSACLSVLAPICSNPAPCSDIVSCPFLSMRHAARRNGSDNPVFTNSPLFVQELGPVTQRP